MPTQRAMEMGLFEIKESTHIDGNGCNVTNENDKGDRKKGSNISSTAT